MSVVNIADNPQLSSLGPLASLQTLSSLTVEGTKVSTLSELSGLVSMDSLDLSENLALESLAGLDALESVGVLSIRLNPEFTSLAALIDGALTEVTETFHIAGNAALPSCEAKALYDKLNDPPDDYCFENVVDAASGPALRHLRPSRRGRGCAK